MERVWRQPILPPTTHKHHRCSMSGQHVGHDGGDEAGAVTLMLELTSDLVGTAPQLGTQLDGLGKVLDVGWHAGLLRMSEVMAVVMWVVDDKMLVEVDRIKDGHLLHGHQVLVPIQRLNFVLAGGMVAQPLQERDVFLPAIASEVWLVDRVARLLAGIGRPELLLHFISPGHLDG